MGLNPYKLKVGDSALEYTFISEGVKGNILKIIQFVEVEENVFNLAMGDLNSKNELDDLVISNNGDLDKVLSTVVASIYLFTTDYPNAFIYVSGSSAARTRLYQMKVSKHIEEASLQFNIYGRGNNAWEMFKKDVNYQEFLIVRKIL